MALKVFDKLKIFIKKRPKNFLGIDIGTSTIKAVEISEEGGGLKLKNYGLFFLEEYLEKPFQAYYKESPLFFSTSDIGRALKSTLKEAKIFIRQTNFTIPDFSSLFTNIELPPMAEKEISQAVYFQAKRYIPLPLNEVTLDWMIIGGKPGDKTGAKIKILLVAVPKEIISQYQEIAKLADLELQTLEAEAFALRRALMKKGDQRLTCLIDIGAQSTTCSLVDNEIIQASHSFDVSGNQLTRVLAGSLDISWREAEKIKKKYGLTPKTKEKVAEILLPLIDLILTEIKKLIQLEGQEPAFYILAGGTALMPGLREYFEKVLNKKVIIANPFEGLSFPSFLEPTLRQMGPTLSVAVGAALRALE